ncbi:MAG: type VII secretion-associated serine protease mycosin [Mycobacteriales bacterium]
MSKRGSRLVPSGSFVLGLVAALLIALGSPAVAYADAARDAQWQLGFLRVGEAWEHSTGRGEVVAVIDSGVDATHPDLRERVLPGHDFVDGSTDGRQDPVGHGTGVASLIAGEADSRGVAGIAPEAKILPIRVLDQRNEYDSAAQIASAVRWATDHGADVINLSLGSAQGAAVLNDALAYAAGHDVVVVACTGNISNRRGSRVWHPAREPGVIAVAGMTKQGEFWKGSLTGAETVMSAPATEIIAAHPGGDYQTMQGTSFAAPLVAASAALVRAAHPELGAASVVQRLISAAWDYGAPGRDDKFGYGIVNPTRAITARVGAVATNPLGNGAGAQQAAEDSSAVSGASPQRPGKPGPIPRAQPAQPEPISTLRLLVLVSVVVAVLTALCCLAVVLRRSRVNRHRRARAQAASRSSGYLPEP